MLAKDIYLYATINSWLEEAPDAVLKGTINSRNDKYIEIQDENGYIQIINIDKLFSIVYER